MVLDSDAIVVTGPPGEDFASRGAHKLIGALDAFEPLGLRSPGASSVGRWRVDRRVHRRTSAPRRRACDRCGRGLWATGVAVAVGPRVTVVDRTNIRYRPPMTCRTGRTWWWPTCRSSRCDWCCPALVGVAAADADLVLMVKPQFEVGRERLGKGGVVRDPVLWDEAVSGCRLPRLDSDGSSGRRREALPGPAGNVEFFPGCAAPKPERDLRGCRRRRLACGHGGLRRRAAHQRPRPG